MFCLTLVAILFFGLTIRISLASLDSLQREFPGLAHTQQVLWNTLQGRPLQSTIPIGQGVPPILLPFSALALLGGNPKYLLVLQVLVAVLGAFPTYTLTARLFRNPVAGLVFGLLFLVMIFTLLVENPDFYGVVLWPTGLLLALSLREAGHPKAFAACALLAASTGLGSGALVLSIGIALWLRRERPKIAGLVVAGSGVLILLSLILSAGNPLEEIWGALPYLLLPLLVWFLGLGMAHGRAKLASALDLAQGPTTATLLTSVVVFSLLWGYSILAPLPLGALLTAEPHPHITQISTLASLVPVNGAVATQTVLAPHLSQQRNLYLLPQLGDSDYVIADISLVGVSPDPPQLQQMVNNLIQRGEFGVWHAQDGLLVLKRGMANPRLPADLFSFACPSPEELTIPLDATFDDVVQLVGYRQDPFLAGSNADVLLSTYWRALRTPPGKLALSYFAVKADDTLTRIHAAVSPTLVWLPAQEWKPNGVVKVEAVLPRSQANGNLALAMDLHETATPVPKRLAPSISIGQQLFPLQGDKTSSNELQLEKVLALSPVPSSRPTSGAPTPTPTATQIPPAKPVILSPLCGKEVSGVSETQLRPVLVKIDNTSYSRPQAGLSQACLVFEHLTEAGITRFGALFHSESPDPVGPVRSARPIDLDLAPAFQALFSHVGANEIVMKQIANSPIADLDQFWDGKWQAYYRLPARDAPYNIYTSIAKLRAWAAQKGLDTPVNLVPYPFLTEKGALASPTIISVKIPFAPGNLVEYRYDPSHNSYLRFVNGEPQTDANNQQQLRATNVMVLYTKVWPTDFRDVNGAPVLEFDLRGEGKIEVFRDGQWSAGKWVRKTATDQFQFLDEGGQVMTFRAGNIWIAVVSTNTTIAKEGPSSPQQ